MATFGNNTPAGTDEVTHSAGYVWCVPGTFPATSGATLSSASINARRGDGGTVRLRVAIYQGGASDSDPTGATLIEDLGVLEFASSTFVTTTLTSASNPALTASTRTWFFMKQDYNGFVYRDTTSPSGEIATGYLVVLSGMSEDYTAAFPGTVPSVSVAGDVGDLSVWLTYAEGGGGPSAGAIQHYRRLCGLEG